MAAPAPSKEAISLILDVGAGTSAESFDLARNIARNIVQQKILFAPRDELGVVLGGTPGALNSLNHADTNRGKHLTVAKPMMCPTLETLKALDEATMTATGGPSLDLLEAIVVGADLIHQATGDRKYGRRIFLISAVTGAVENKAMLQPVIDVLKAKKISLVVVGIDFDSDETIASTVNDDWSTMSDKKKNERVLHHVVTQLQDEQSAIVPVAMMADAVTALRKKVVAQRTASRCILQIGTIKIPVHLFVKALSTRVPTMHRTTAKGDFTTERRYFSVRDPDKELTPENRLKAYRFGKSIIPFSEVDEGALKFPAERSLQCLGFVSRDEIPMHLLMGGTKAVAGVPGDTPGLEAFSAFFHGMEQLNKAMVLRFVWRENAAPTIGIMFPSTGVKADGTPASREPIGYWAPLPFAEDLRHWSFRSFDAVNVGSEEAKAVSTMVDSMDLDGLLAPKETFNPAIQQYYNAVARRFVDPTAAIPPIPASVKQTSTAWGQPGNVLHETLKSATPAIAAVREKFPYTPPSRDGPVAGAPKKAKPLWFAHAIGGADDSEALPQARARHEVPPSAGPSIAAMGDHSVTSTGTPSTPSGPSQLPAPVTTTASAATHVNTVDPAGSFLKLVNEPGADNISRAILEVTEVVLRLMRSGFGREYDERCEAAVLALRQVCVREGEPIAFNRFMVNLQLASRVPGAREDGRFWTERIATKGVKPIARDECEESDLSPEAAARFFGEARSLPVVESATAPGEDDIFGLLE